MKTKTDLVDALASKADITKAQASAAIDAFVATVQDSLKAGEEVRLTGFGTFTVKHRAAGKGRNIRTGEITDVPAKNVAGFKPGAGLKDAING